MGVILSGKHPTPRRNTEEADSGENQKSDGCDDERRHKRAEMERTQVNTRLRIDSLQSPLFQTQRTTWNVNEPIMRLPQCSVSRMPTRFTGREKYSRSRADKDETSHQQHAF